MASAIRGNLAIVCAQLRTLPNGLTVPAYPGCHNMTKEGFEPNNDSSQRCSVLCDKFTSSLGPTGDYIAGFVVMCIIVPAMVMNSFVIWSFAVRRGTAISVDYYILTLAISDLCAVTFAYPLTMTSMFLHRWLFGDTGCRISGFLGFFFGIVDIFILSTISFTRYLCVCHPLSYGLLTRGKVALSLLGVLLMAALWAGLPLAGWGEYDVEPFGTSCTLQWATPDHSYVTTIFMFCLMLPLLVMLTSYGCILRRTRAASRRIRHHAKEGLTSARRTKHERRLIKITVLMTVCFLAAWTPYSLVSMLSAYVDGVRITGVSSIVPTLLAKTSHLANPVVYFAMNTRFSATPFRCPCLGALRPKLPFSRSRPISSSCESFKSVQLQNDVHMEYIGNVGRRASKQGAKKGRVEVLRLQQLKAEDDSVSLVSNSVFARGLKPRLVELTVISISDGSLSESASSSFSRKPHSFKNRFWGPKISSCGLRRRLSSPF